MKFLHYGKNSSKTDLKTAFITIIICVIAVLIVVKMTWLAIIIVLLGNFIYFLCICISEGFWKAIIKTLKRLLLDW